MAPSRSLNVVISGDSRSLKKAFASAESSAASFAGKVEGAGSRATHALGLFAKSGALAAGVGFGAILKAGVEYEKQMARVRGVTNATGDDMKKLGGLAKQLGADTKFSAGEAADAMYELGSAGFKVNDMAKVLPGTLSLAAASGVELKDAAEISANALNGFGLASDQMGHVADVLATTTNRTSVEMSDLQLTMKYIGPVAKATGQDFETMLAAVGEMGNVGIKGEQAGTTLRSALLRLTNPTASVAEGFKKLGLGSEALNGPKGLKPLPEIIKILEERTKGMDKSTRNAALAQIFGTEAMSGMVALVDQGSKALEKNADANRKSEGAAKKAADIMNDTVAGAWDSFTGSVETASISLYETFQPALKDALGWAADFVNDVVKIPGKLADAFGKMKDEKGSAGAALGAMVVAGIDGIDWGALGEKVSKGFNSALKIGGKVGSAIVDAFQQVPWDKVGDAIGKGVEGSLNFADTLPAKISAGISAAVSQVNGRQVLGKLIDIVGEAIDAMFSPSFWAEHWKGILATVTLAIPVAKLLKIPGANTLFKFISKPVFDAALWMGKGLLTLLGKAASEAGLRFLVELEKVAPKLAGVMLKLVTASGRGLLKLPGRLAEIAGNAALAVAGKLGDATGMIVGKMTAWVVKGVAALGRRVGEFAKTGSAVGRSILGGILTGLGGMAHAILEKIKDAWDWVKKNIKLPEIKLPFGLGSVGGDGLGMIGGAGLGGGSLMGAKSIMSPFVSAAGRFGLHTSSGLRPGAITSSGNPSFHGSGNAVDESGTPSGMMGYFRYLKAKFGTRLRELIYTPGGVGIKDGKPFQYTGQVAADHFDHVHVAYTGGAGDGVGRKRGTGDGIGEIKSLWTRAGGSSSAQNMAAAIAMAESGGRPTVTNRNSDGSIDRGLWQINSVHGALSTLDRMGNARAAVKISSNGRNWNPWTVFKTGAYKRFLGSGSSGSSGPSKGKATGTTQGGKLPAITPAFYEPAEGPSEEALAAQGFLDRRAGVGARPAKGGGPSKGISQELADARDNAPVVDPNADLAGFSEDIRARAALAALTEGTGDDVDAAAAAVWLAQVKMDRALASGNSGRIADAATDLKSSQDALKGFQGAITDNTAALQAHTDALKAVGDELKRQTDFAASVQSTSNFQLTKSIADLVSGHIAGRGIAGRAFTPGSGVEWAY